MSPLDPESQRPLQQQTPPPAPRAVSTSTVKAAAPAGAMRRAQRLPVMRQTGSTTIDERFILPACPTLSEEIMAPVIALVEPAVAAKSSAASPSNPRLLQSYRSIVDCLRKKQDPEMLFRLLIVLRVSGKTLHHLINSSKAHAQLMHCIFKLDPFYVPKSQASNEKYREMLSTFRLADAQLHLLVALVSANSIYSIPALSALWKLLVQGEQKERTNRLRAAIATLLRLVPKATTEFMSLVISEFPFRINPQVVSYAQHCLQMLEYAPSLHAQVLELLVDKALEMDVEIKINEAGLAEIDPEEFVKADDHDAIFELEDVAPPKQPAAASTIDEMADKLDSIMLLLFQHVKDKTKSDPVAASQLFYIIMPVFERTILTTYRSKYVQFIVLQLLHIGDGDLYREFCAKLIEIVLDPLRSSLIVRQSAACYLASYVSRANYICSETITESVAAFLRWAETYIETLDADTVLPLDVHVQCEMHSLFYTVCQAAFYVMCFHGTAAVSYHQDAVAYFGRMDDNEHNAETDEFPDLEHIDIRQERWEKICGHRLQPLRFCLESVREEFLAVADVYKLLDPILLKKLEQEAHQQSSGIVNKKIKKPRGKRISTPVTLASQRRTGGVGGLGRGSNPLDSFFPFDPYLLRRSHEYVEPLYKNWEGGVEEVVQEDELQQEDDDDDDDDDDDEEVEVQEDEGSDDDDQDSEHMTTASVETTAFLQQQSYNSATSFASTTARSPVSPPTIGEYRQAQQEAWSSALKRPRAPSIAENGSW